MATSTDAEVRLVRNTLFGGVHVDADSLFGTPASDDPCYVTFCCGRTVPVESSRWQWVVGYEPGALCGACVRVLGTEDRVRVWRGVHRGGA